MLRQSTEYGKRQFLEGKFNSLGVCRRCREGPCMRVCPLAAIDRAADGSVSIAAMKCNGCQLCVVACPSGVILFDAGSKIARLFDQPVMRRH